MDAPLNKSGRVCFSFPAGTLDLAELAPHHTVARTGTGGHTVALRLEARHWQDWIARLGPVILHVRNAWCMGAASLPCAEFLPVPASRDWVESRSGLAVGDMIRWRIQAFVEPWGAQEAGGVVFIDDEGCERLRLYLSHISDLEAFDEMIVSCAVESTWRSWQPHSPPSVQLRPAPVDVLRAWDGLGKHPGSDEHHAWPGVSRRAWLAAAGTANARPQTPASLLRLLCQCAGRHLPLTLLPHLPSTHAPISLSPQRIGRCACGVHVFGQSSQYKLGPLEKMDLWMALYPADRGHAQFIWHAFAPEGCLAWTLTSSVAHHSPVLAEWNHLCGGLWDLGT